jgi:hypothetical protein
MSKFWYSEYSSLLVAPQSAFGTPNTSFVDSTDLGDFRALLCDKPKFTPATEVVETDLLTGIIAASPERLVGRRSGTLTFTQPLEAFIKGYDGTSTPGTTEVAPHWACLLANALGSNASAVAGSAADFWAGMHMSNSAKISTNILSGSTSTSLNLDATSTLHAGQLIVAAGSVSDTEPTIAWIKGLNTGTGVATLFEAGKNTAQTNDATFGTATGWVSSEALEQLPLTFRWIGKDESLCYVLTDAICESVKVTWESGAVPVAEFSFKVYDYQVDSAFAGGLVIPDAYNRVPQIVGGVNGRATIDTDAFEGIEKAEFTFKIEVKEIKSHNASQGIGNVILVKPRLSASFSVPHLNDQPVTAGSFVWQSKLQTQTTVSVGCYVGSVVGKIFSFLIPAARIVAVPALEDRDGIIAYTLQLEASKYTDDTETSIDPTAPTNSLFRFALA